MPDASSPGALSNLKVLDLSRILAGPWATQIFADLGAEVIKVERPGAGDDTRTWGPPFTESGVAGYFLSANRGKKSIEVDIADPEGQALLRKLAAKADVLVENYKVGGLKKYGLDYESLKAVNPKLIYCSITGFGQTGPFSHRAGYDFLLQGMGGLMSITGEADDLPGGGPQKVGVAVADLFTGMYSAVAVLAALRHRDQTGEGQYIDSALLDCQVAMLANQATNYLLSDEVPERLGNAHPNIVPYQAFKALDGHLIIAVGNDRQFKDLCRVLGRRQLAEDERFATNRDRVANRRTLVSIIADIVTERPVAEWMSELESAYVPCGPINTIDGVFADPQVQARDLVKDLALASGDEVKLVGFPVRMSATPAQAKAPPKLGQHNGLEDFES
ncbi:MAG: CaiB/BaiF CoA-transferase family protein [Maricaulaceae bacterium]|jgi:formyl-CoA transferase